MEKKSFIKRFAIKGLHYYQDFELVFENPVTILVGENGLGKTTVLNVLYAVLRKRWIFLSDIGFDFIELEFTNGTTVSFSHSELEGYLIVKYFRQEIESDETKRKFEVVADSVKGLQTKFTQFEGIISKAIENPILYLPDIRNLRDNLSVFGIGFDRLSTAMGFPSYDDELESIENEILIPLDLNYLGNKFFGRKKGNLVVKFIDIANKYLVNTKMVVDQKHSNILIMNKISDEIISFNQLSSGEKQILYIFANVYLTHDNDVCILFDEPELSLSITWQRKILADIVNSGKCSFLLAITHSPFTFDNELDKFAQGINVCFK